jgi:hypothetical protein
MIPQDYATSHYITVELEIIFYPLAFTRFFELKYFACLSLVSHQNYSLYEGMKHSIQQQIVFQFYTIKSLKERRLQSTSIFVNIQNTYETAISYFGCFG